jgi:hypothetical protein
MQGCMFEDGERTDAAQQLPSGQAPGIQRELLRAI